MIQPFEPCFIFESELASYGLPGASGTCGNTTIMALVRMASSIIDEECGRIDGDGNGSLVYSTYSQRELLQTANRNLIYLPMKPVVPIPQATVDELIALATDAPNNYWYTGVMPNTQISQFTNTLSPLIGASGRYGYTRQDRQGGYPDAFAFINPINLITLYGGPAPFVQMDITNADVAQNTGEVWLPAGIQLQQYSEAIMVYNSGFDPRNLPRGLKWATATLVKNIMAKGSGTTAMTSLNLGKAGANAQFYADLVDPVLRRMLAPYTQVRGY